MERKKKIENEEFINRVKTRFAVRSQKFLRDLVHANTIFEVLGTWKEFREWKNFLREEDVQK